MLQNSTIVVCPCASGSTPKPRKIIGTIAAATVLRSTACGLSAGGNESSYLEIPGTAIQRVSFYEDDRLNKRPDSPNSSEVSRKKFAMLFNARTQNQSFPRVLLLGTILQCMFLICVAATQAAEVGLYWNGNRESDLAGYKIHYGRSSRDYSKVIDVGNDRSYLLRNLLAGRRYYFAVSAYDQSGRESELSRELSAVTDSEQNALEPEENDGDGDGLFDEDEVRRGTDPDVADSDNDGVVDGQEIIDGTKALDRGSSAVVLGTRFCSEWNGFLAHLWNILEMVNTGSERRQAFVTVYRRDGRIANNSLYRVGAGEQLDVLVHDNPARQENSYGLVCIRHDGEPGDLDGRMVYYKGEPNPAIGGFQFAFAFPFTEGKKGKQSVHFNTYQPSFRPGDQSNLVANWLQLTNPGNAEGSGDLLFYDLEGRLMERVAVRVDGGERIDISGHRFGPNRAGLVSWVPDRDDQRFLFRNVRYLYDNPYGVDSFATAYELEGMFPTGEILHVPVSTMAETAVVELSNSSSERVRVRMRGYDEGTLAKIMDIELDPHATRHIIVNDIIGATWSGLVTFDSDTRSSILAVSMQYARTPDGGVSQMYGLAAVPTVGTVIRGSYNTFLEQLSDLWVSNPTASTQAFTFNLKRSGSSPVGRTSPVEIPPHSVRLVRLNNYESPNHYGVLTVQAEEQNTLSAAVMRRGNAYVIPTPLH